MDVDGYRAVSRACAGGEYDEDSSKEHNMVLAVIYEVAADIIDRLERIEKIIGADLSYKQEKDL